MHLCVCVLYVCMKLSDLLMINLRHALVECDEHESLARLARSDHTNKFVGHHIHHLCHTVPDSDDG